MSLSEKGQEHRAKIALALYDARAASEAMTDVEEAAAAPMVAVPAAVTAAAAVIFWIFSCNKNGIDADKPIGMPWRVYNTTSNA